MVKVVRIVVLRVWMFGFFWISWQHSWVTWSGGFFFIAWMGFVIAELGGSLVIPLRILGSFGLGGSIFGLGG